MLLCTRKCEKEGGEIYFFTFNTLRSVPKTVSKTFYFSVFALFCLYKKGLMKCCLHVCLYLSICKCIGVFLFFLFVINTWYNIHGRKKSLFKKNLRAIITRDLLARIVFCVSSVPVVFLGLLWCRAHSEKSTHSKRNVTRLGLNFPVLFLNLCFKKGFSFLWVCVVVELFQCRCKSAASFVVVYVFSKKD